MRINAPVFASALLLVMLMFSGCASDQSESQVRALTNSFFAYLRAGEADKAAALVEGSGGTIQPLMRAAENQKDLIPSYFIERLQRVDANTEQVFVLIPGNDTTTTIALVARRSGESWKLDSTIQVETRINSIINTDGSTDPQANQ